MASRESVIKQIIETLITKNKPNALMVGPAGVGKTMNTETRAYEILREKVRVRQ
jgi:ATP-dependent Clp protease ATP-binding subunit ClpA